jgi:4-cresol dehydrogenase (hydroxylating)|nr:FAD-binding oxidoreductase [Clavibacter michiganensis]
MSITEPTARPIGDIDRALAAFTILLGEDAVITDPQELLAFRDPFTYRESDQWDASACVMPTSTEQVSAVVKIANEHGVPLWTFSQGRNNTYGGPAPRVPGSVIVNLRNMNRVLEINEELAYAVVEPGVRWFDLFDALEEAGGKLWTSIPDLGWGSVIGNSSEYGRGYTPYGDHAENICGLEVVLPTGEIVRTGMGGMIGSQSAHIYKHAFGPQLQGLFQSSGLGIITRMGYWLQRRPEAYASCWLSFRGDEALAASIDLMRELMLDGTVTNYPVVLHGVELDADGNPSFSPEKDLWLVRFALYGRPEIVDANWAACERLFGAVPGMSLRRRVYAGDDRTSHAGHEDRVMAGIPDMDILDLFQSVYGEDTAHLDFSPVGPLRGADVVETAHLMRGLYEKTGERFFSGLMLSPRSVIHISTMFFDPHDEKQTAAVYENYSAMLAVMRDRGYPVYRTNLQHMDAVAAQFDFNDNALLRLNERIKDALDPNGIMQPGKSGVWARRYRETAQ